MISEYGALVNKGKVKTKLFREILPHCHFEHHRSYVDNTGIEVRPL
jgi:hypothetical protein